jgi:hypothetical protein
MAFDGHWCHYPTASDPWHSSQIRRGSKQVGTYAGKDWSGRAQVPEREQTIGGYTNVMAGGPTGSRGDQNMP